jgi:hypothetical protein
MTSTALPITIDPELLVNLWNIRAGINLFAGQIGKLPKPTHDPDGRKVVSIPVGDLPGARLVMVLGTDGMVRAAAIQTNSGGYDQGEMSRYVIVDMLDENLAVALTGDTTDSVMQTLGLGSGGDSAPRINVSRTTILAPYDFRLITTPDQGDWFIVTATSP